MPNAGTVNMIELSTSSHVKPTSPANLAWRKMPAGLRRITVHTSRISSWVLRSGAGRESIWLSHELWASCSAGNSACSASSKGKLQSRASVTRSARGPELDDRHFVRRRVEHRVQGHADLQRVELAVDDVRHHARALGEIDDGGDVRHSLAERWEVVPVHHRPRVERRLPTRLEPLDVVAPALGAERPWVEVVLAARVAVLDEQLAVARRVPER